MALFIIFFIFSLFSSLSVPSGAQVRVKGCPFDSIYSFGGGDSSNSDGLLVLDHLASAFHVPSPNPYLKKDAKFDYGVKFDADGATALNTSFFEKKGIQLPSTNSSLEAQLDSFTTYLDSICSSHESTYLNLDCAKKKLHRALFLVGEIANNDYSYALFQGKTIEEVASYVPQVVQSIKDTIRRLILEGAYNLVVPGTLPIGCLPAYLTKFHSDDPMHFDSKNCLRGLNTFARLHNDHLWQALTELRLEYPQVHIVYADYYRAFMTLLHNPIVLGFERHSLMKTCCGSGGLYNFDPMKNCGDQGVPVCSELAKYIHWDGFHLTQEAYKHMAEGLISGSFVYPEFKLQERLHCSM
ncbi:hypothetical protein HHK36_015895 [Tetracentron sinense]|uniref:Uncharacterized protein n=1 Tax=Tetracentron sinense TaxID=13715 RepID=A0A835DEB2_TETSI|nr:hypothetical protein HHK36_015895 [Tetracentron sinense]